MAAANLDSYAQKETLYNLINEAIEKSVGDKDGRKINRLEKGMTRFIARQWNLLVTKAISKAVDEIDARSPHPVTEREGKKILSTLESEISKVSKKTEARISTDIEKIYEANRTQFRGRFRLREEKNLYFDEKVVSDIEINKALSCEVLKQSKESFTKVLSEADKLAVENLARLHRLGVGDHFSNNHKKFISEMIDNAVVRQGMPKKQAGEFLMERLSRRLGGFQQSVPASLKSAGQRAASAYFEGLSATSVTRARNFSQINLMDEVGITRLTWASIIDNRTSQICAEMNGRVFTIQQVKAQKNSILEQETAEALKSNFGWKKNLSEFGLRAGEGLNSAEASDLLARNGVPIIPPAHFRCRSELVPS